MGSNYFLLIPWKGLCNEKNVTSTSPIKCLLIYSKQTFNLRRLGMLNYIRVIFVTVETHRYPEDVFETL